LWTTENVSLAVSNSIRPALKKALISLPPEQRGDIKAINNVIAALPLVFGILPTNEQQTSSPSEEFDPLFVLHELIYNEKLSSLMTPHTRGKLLKTATWLKIRCTSDTEECKYILDSLISYINMKDCYHIYIDS
jgi:hypothetical protein